MEQNLKSRQTMHLIRAKGLELFYKKGYYNTSVDDILQELSLSKGAFYHHFQSKEDFFISIAQNLILHKVLRLLIEPVTYKQNPFPLVLDLIDNALENAENNENDHGFLLANFINEFNGRNTKINKYLQDILKIWEINLVSLFKKGQMEGYLNKHVDCESVANYVISSYFGVRTMMVEGNARMLHLQFMQQLRYYFYSISQKEMV